MRIYRTYTLVPSMYTALYDRKSKEKRERNTSPLLSMPLWSYNYLESDIDRGFIAHRAEQNARKCFLR